MRTLNIDDLGKPVSKVDAQLVDPNHVLEVYVNAPISGYMSDGHVHLTLGIERPVLGDKSAQPHVQKVVVSRLVIPAHIAVALASAILTTARPAAGTT